MIKLSDLPMSVHPIMATAVVGHLRPEWIARRDPGVVEPGRLRQPRPAHDGLGQFVEDRGQGPDLGQANVVEGDAEAARAASVAYP
jgi:hypothetical protein